MATIRISEDRASLAKAAAAEFARSAHECVERKGRFSVALAGGSTPKALYALLADAPYREELPWDRTWLVIGDERTVPDDHPESNVAMVREQLLRPIDFDETRLVRFRGDHHDPARAADEFERHLTHRLGEPPTIDLVLLGLGADAHTASLFPYTTALDEAGRWAVANRVDAHDTWRLTLTARTINRARRVLFLVAGSDKADAVHAVLEGERDPHRYPAQFVAPGDGDVVWMIDRAASTKLTQVVTGR